MTPFSSVAILEKLALLKIAFCKAPVLSRASSRRTSVTTSTVPAASSETTGSWSCGDMFRPPSGGLDRHSHLSLSDPYYPNLPQKRPLFAACPAGWPFGTTGQVGLQCRFTDANRHHRGRHSAGRGTA